MFPPPSTAYTPFGVSWVNDFQYRPPPASCQSGWLTIPLLGPAPHPEDFRALSSALKWGWLVLFGALLVSVPRATIAGSNGVSSFLA